VAAVVLMNSACLTRKLKKLHQGWFTPFRVNHFLRTSKALSFEDRLSLQRPWQERATRHSLIQSFSALEKSWPSHYEQQVWKKAIGELYQPVLLLWGERDLINPTDVGAGLVQKLPGAWFFSHEDLGHWPSLENPQWVLSKLKDFIFKVSDR